MEVQNMSCTKTTTTNEFVDDDHVPLPGFRFHPTDEELVGFYLRRKVDRKPISIELIKQADIYKYDPWDLPRSTNVGEKDKEWYFFCKRGRKYKNSVRPNRVTGSGFWKATGIDRPVISSNRDCIGLKKSLVYYRGSAGKGTKTEWMMHEFRLPTKHPDNVVPVDAREAAEVWTLCRILKRSAPYRKSVPDWRLVNKKSGSNVNNNVVLINPLCSETCSVESSDYNGLSPSPSSYISFSAPVIKRSSVDAKSPYLSYSGRANNDQNEFLVQQCFRQAPAPTALSSYKTNCNGIIDGDFNELLRHANWEDLRSVVDCAATASSSSMYL